MSPGSTELRAGLVTFVTAGDATVAERKAIGEAAEIANVVRSSACFYDFIARRNLVATNGRRPGEVAEHLQILSGVPLHGSFEDVPGAERRSRLSSAAGRHDLSQPRTFRHLP